MKLQLILLDDLFYRGAVPYTAYNARKSYIENNPEVIKNFTKAVNKALVYVKEHSSSEIADLIMNQFPNTSKEDMITIIDRYKNAGAWKENITINEKEWQHIEEILMTAGELNSMVDYDKLIYSKYFKDYE